MAQDTISLELEPRKVMGKAVKHLRREGRIPAVIHDHGKASVHVQADSIALLKVWRQAGKHHPVELETELEHSVATVYEPSALAAANEAAAGEAEPGDEAEVEAEEGGDTDQEAQAPEDRPGGKDQKEPKPTSVEAAKEEKHEQNK